MRTTEETANQRRRWRTAVFIAGCVAFGAAAVPGMAYGLTLLNVFVTNTPAHPVPTKPVGTTPVSGEVTALQPGEPVTVVRQLLHDSRFDRHLTTSGYLVPDGKRFVLDSVGVTATIYNSGAIQVEAVGGRPGAEFSFPVPVTAPQFAAEPNSLGHRIGFVSGTAEPHAVLEAGSTIVFQITREDADIAPAAGGDPIRTRDVVTIIGRLLPAT